MKKIELKLMLVFSFFITLPAFSQQNKEDSLAKRHDELMKIIMTKPKFPIKTIGIYVYDGYNTLDAIGPYQVLSELMSVNIFFVAKEKGMVKNQRGLKVQVDKSFADVDKLDILVIPGGTKETFLQTQDSTVLNWIQKIDKTTTYTTSVCTGGWILGATGLLKDKNVTCNWYNAAEIMKMYGANFKQERYVQDGKYWTSAGVTAGMDMALGIMNDLMGEKYTKGVMLDLEYDPKPPYNAGSITNTDEIVVDMMTQMYDMGLKPLFDAEIEKRTPKKKSIFELWPALDEYHKVIAASFHPAENADLKPLLNNAKELEIKAKTLKLSPIPVDLQQKNLANTLNLLAKESAALTKMVAKKKPEAELKKAIFALHDRFHEIVEKCMDH